MDSATTTHGGIRGLLDELDRLHAAGKAAVLGIVVATEGSTYQKPGALVLLDRSGMRHGVISGGCLEPELERRAEAVFASGCAALVDFDTRSDEDLVFGSGTGCRGRVHLLLLPQPADAPLAQALRHASQAGLALNLALILSGAAPGSGTATCERSQATAPINWSWNAEGAAQQAMAIEPDCRLRIAPPPRVLLLGAGPETPPLLESMQRFGWFTTVVEHRGRWSAFARAGNAGRFVEAAPALAFEALAGERSDAAIVMSHNYTLDAQYLRFCAGRDIGYVGLLGPGGRRDQLLAELGDAATALLPRLHAPVGLDLGGTGPEAIALAIVAELQQTFARRNA
jgi:xanthine dehydrogenase accessory factor